MIAMPDMLHGFLVVSGRVAALVLVASMAVSVATGNPTTLDGEHYPDRMSSRMYAVIYYVVVAVLAFMLFCLCYAVFA